MTCISKFTSGVNCFKGSIEIFIHFILLARLLLLHSTAANSWQIPPLILRVRVDLNSVQFGSMEVFCGRPSTYNYGLNCPFQKLLVTVAHKKLSSVFVEPEFYCRKSLFVVLFCSGLYLNYLVIGIYPRDFLSV